MAVAIILFSVGIARRVDGQTASISEQTSQEVVQDTPEPTQIPAEVAPVEDIKVKTIEHTNTKISKRTGDCEQYRAIVERYFPSKEVNIMLRVISAESGCNATAHNWKDKHKTCMGSHGLFQIGCVHGYSPDQLEDPEFNIKVAAQVWKTQGYKAWGVCTRHKVNCGV